jgi:hypothetical protein
VTAVMIMTHTKSKAKGSTRAHGYGVVVREWAVTEAAAVELLHTGLGYSCAYR